VSKLAAFRMGQVSSSEDFSGKGSSLGNIFSFYKTKHILLSDNANCTVLRAVVLTQYQRVTEGRTDRQTDGIAIASTAHAKRRAVKIHARPNFVKFSVRVTCGRGSVLLRQQCNTLCTSGFVDYVVCQ